MAGYEPKRPRPTDGPRLVGLPGDPLPPVADVASPPDVAGPEPQVGPTGRVLPRAAPPLDRRLPPAALAGAAVGVLALSLVWRRWQRRR